MFSITKEQAAKYMLDEDIEIDKIIDDNSGVEIRLTKGLGKICQELGLTAGTVNENYRCLVGDTFILTQKEEGFMKEKRAMMVNNLISQLRNLYDAVFDLIIDNEDFDIRDIYYDYFNQHFEIYL